jgi:hypothetical protein
MRIIACLCALTVLAVTIIYSQSKPRKSSGVHVDTSGVLRWNGSDEEVRLFGVNYTIPFAYSYRAHKRLGLSIKKAIDLDVAQLARLGLDAYRVHVWDREVSDQNGDLLENEHLDLFDYLLAKLADRGFSVILTPIAWWGNGWPEPDEATKGFSQQYTKAELITNPKARQAERNYLRQFVKHANPYRNVSYGNDPSIIALEIVNEPRHPDSAVATTEYINAMAGVLRGAGFVKPIFYNISENWGDVQANAVTSSNIDGVSFQWYPTDLVHNRMLKGNYLINVNKYAIPSENLAGFNEKAKMVYEFDAADVGGSYMYPAMARSLREAGMQFATMFSYDPVQIAWSNTEYPTHFLNLLYTPSKAISLMIAGKAFRKLPRIKSFGAYPENNRFDDFSVSYEENLSEMNTSSEFVYSNSTQTRPKDAGALRHVAGCGSSPVVRYDGTGAYFLDELEDGIWRLEVYPDVLWIHDPFEPAGMGRQPARLFWNKREMKISLPDLGEWYTLHPSSKSRQRASQAGFSPTGVTPGIYIVAAENADRKKIAKYASTKESFLDGLYVPPARAPRIYVVNNTSHYMLELGKIDFKFQIAGEREIANATLYMRRPGWPGFAEHGLKNVGGFSYTAADTPKIMQSGTVEYCVAVDDGRNTYTFPGEVQNTPGKWDFSTNSLWTVRVVKSGESIVLLDAQRDRDDFIFPRYSQGLRYLVDYRDGTNSEETALALKVTVSDERTIPFGLQLNVSKLVEPLDSDLGSYRHIVVKARSSQDSACTIGIVFLMADGRSYGADVDITDDWREVVIPLSAFRNRSALILPESYPLFLPKVWNGNAGAGAGEPDMRTLESVQILLDSPGTKGANSSKEFNVEIVSVGLRR